MKKWFEKIEAAIREAEIKFGAGGGADKRLYVIDIINKLVDIPMVPEWIEAKIIGLLVDFAVHLFNEKFGKRWLDVMPAGKTV